MFEEMKEVFTGPSDKDKDRPAKKPTGDEIAKQRARLASQLEKIEQQKLKAIERAELEKDSIEDELFVLQRKCERYVGHMFPPDSPGIGCSYCGYVTPIP